MAAAVGTDSSAHKPRRGEDTKKAERERGEVVALARWGVEGVRDVVGRGFGGGRGGWNHKPRTKKKRLTQKQTTVEATENLKIKLPKKNNNLNSVRFWFFFLVYRVLLGFSPRTTGTFDGDYPPFPRRDVPLFSLSLDLFFSASCFPHILLRLVVWSAFTGFYFLPSFHFTRKQWILDTYCRSPVMVRVFFSLQLRFPFSPKKSSPGFPRSFFFTFHSIGSPKTRKNATKLRSDKSHRVAKVSR